MIGRLEQIVGEALERPEHEREEFLARQCAADDRLRREAESLIRAHEQAGQFLLHPTPCVPPHDGDARPDSPRAVSPGSVVGPYKLLQQIGEGGFGTVFLAEQRTPVQRRVAVKILKLGMDTGSVLARFEAERQALAMMDHPNIARVLDAGATETGRPYFAMELVRGVPITTFCDEERLSIGDRLALFIEVCHAVQHAHTKGIIHRDLKPSNILVSRYDDRPGVKVIDFGIAKALGGAGLLTDKTLFTDFRHFIGTPAYMSPEQAGMSDLDIDTRGDVYSLGVLLYELLAGVTPIDNKRLLDTDFDEMRRIIREVEPPTPSTSVGATIQRRRLRSGLASRPDDAAVALKDSAEIARRRATDPRALCTELRGDLDWIVMKCLEKDRCRRYETAHGLALDVERHLKNEPVLAGPPSQLYRFRKFAQRNRATVTAAALVAAALLAGMTGTTLGLLRADAALGREREQRHLAEDREKETQQVADFQAAMLSGIDAEKMGRGIKKRLRDQVQAALEREQVGELPNLRLRTREEVEAEMAAFDQRASAAHAVDVARQVMDEFVLAPAASTLKERFADQPLVQAQLHFALGKTYHHLGMFDAAEPHLRAAMEIRQRHYGLESVHPEVAACLYNLAGVICDRGRPDEAEAIYRKALAMWRELYGEEHQMVARTLDALGGAVMAQNRLEEAESLLNASLQLNRAHCGEDDPDVVSNLADLAVVLTKQRKFPEAEALTRQVLETRRRTLGDHDPTVGQSLFNLAQTIAPQGRHADAEALLQEALAIHLDVYAEQHPWIAKIKFNLGVQLAKRGKRAEAERLCQDALAQQRVLLGDHLDVRNTLILLADLRQQEGDHDETVKLLRESLAIAERMYPNGHPEGYRRCSAMGRVGGALASQAKSLLATDRERALALFHEAAHLTSDGLKGMTEYPHIGTLEERRRATQTTAEVFEFWHNVAPDRGWGDRAAEWRAELEELAGP